MLTEILKHTNQYLSDDVEEWLQLTKALQGSKNDYWEVLSITIYFVIIYSEQKNNKKNRVWFRQNTLYIKSNDATIKIFILPSNPCKNCSYKPY